MLKPAELFLIQSIKRGDQKSYEFLFKSYYSKLCKHARNIVQNDDTAEDLVMDIFVKVWEAESLAAAKTSISGYLFQSVHNHCLNYLTRTHKRFSELNPETIERLNALALPDPSYDPFERLNAEELGIKIELSIDQLPEQTRRIFILSRKEELSYKEIAEQTGLSENTVKVQIYRALIKLRILLKEYLPG
jgi:RNA polymerase sigma-70 factor (ECF subfamily)